MVSSAGANDDHNDGGPCRSVQSSDAVVSHATVLRSLDSPSGSHCSRRPESRDTLRGRAVLCPPTSEQRARSGPVACAAGAVVLLRRYQHPSPPEQGMCVVIRSSFHHTSLALALLLRRAGAALVPRKLPWSTPWAAWIGGALVPRFWCRRLAALATVARWGAQPSRIARRSGPLCLRSVSRPRH